ncbi:MAG: hypothetical protein AB7H90_21875 [Alphaproteobacteria bacterium]
MAARECRDKVDGQARQQSSPGLEWLASGLGLVLAVSAIGYIVWEGLQRTGFPPVVTVHVERTVETAAGYVVEIRAANQGDTTAATVEVEGGLVRDGQTVETGGVTFDYLPGRSERKGGLFFKRDPRLYTLQIRAKGFVQP